MLTWEFLCRWMVWRGGLQEFDDFPDQWGWEVAQGSAMGEVVYAEDPRDLKGGWRWRQCDPSCRDERRPNWRWEGKTLAMATCLDQTLGSNGEDDLGGRQLRKRWQKTAHCSVSSYSGVVAWDRDVI